jgi:hypothetical protein
VNPLPLAEPSLLPETSEWKLFGCCVRITAVRPSACGRLVMQRPSSPLAGFLCGKLLKLLSPQSPALFRSGRERRVQKVVTCSGKVETKSKQFNEECINLMHCGLVCMSVHEMKESLDGSIIMCLSLCVFVCVCVRAWVHVCFRAHLVDSSLWHRLFCRVH